jgi:group I intron endonuclease
MTCGIYKLEFSNGKVYIGQSNSIENRFRQHLRKFKNGNHTDLLQSAYNEYGTPILQILCECTPGELDTYENEAIQIYNSVEDGLNMLKTAQSTPINRGETHGMSKFSDTIIESAFLHLVAAPTVNFQVVAELYGVSREILYMISSGCAHVWLKEKYPEEYKTLMSLRGSRRSTSQSSKARGLVYPKIKSPEGIIYEVDNLRQFSLTHNLTRRHLTKVLKGQASHHKGWRLA